MATKAITVDKLARNTFNLDTLEFEAATTAADGFLVDASGVADHNLLLVFKNVNAGTTARTATIKKGNALQGVTDLVSGDVGAGDTAAIVVESGRFLNVTGTNKGKILIIPSHADLTMAAIALP